MEKRKTLCMVGETVNWYSYRKNYEIPQKILKNKTTILSSNPTSGHISEGNEIILKRYLYSYIHCNMVHNNQDINKCPLTDEWITKMKYKHSNIFVRTWISLQGIMLSEIKLI